MRDREQGGVAMSRFRRALLGAAAPALALGLLLGGAAPAHAEAAPLPGTATTKFMSGWLPWWFTNIAWTDPIVANAGSEGFVGEIMQFNAYSRYRTDGTGQQDPVCVHDGSDNKAQECARIAPTTSQKNQQLRMQAAGIKVLPSFTDDSSVGGLGAAMANPAKRTELVAMITTFVMDNGYDGVDLDYEDFAFSYPKSTWEETRKWWVVFITELSAKMRVHGKLLSVTVPAGYPDRGLGYNPSSGYWVYAWDQIIGKVDRLRIMTYDYSWDTAGPIGPADWVDEVAFDAVEELGTANAAKVWLGIAAYGRDWRVVNAALDRCAFPTTSARHTPSPQGMVNTYNAAWAAKRLTSPAWAATKPPIPWSPVSAEYTFSYKEADAEASGPNKGKACFNYRTAWFQDAASHVARAKIAAKYRLGGVAMWDFGEERPGTWTALKAAAPDITPYTPQLTVTAPAQVKYGQTATVAVRAERPDGASIPGLPVTLRWRPAGGSSWTTIQSKVFGDAEQVTFTAVPTRNGEWQVTSPAASYRQSGVSPVVPTAVTSLVTGVVRVRRSAGWALVSTTTATGVRAVLPRGVGAQIAGRVSPVVGPQVATLYRTTSTGALVKLRSVTTSGTLGAWEFAIPTSAPGTTVYRVLVAPSADYARGASLPITVTVR